MDQSSVVRGGNRGASLKHDRDGTRGIKRSFAHEYLAQRVPFEQLHHDVEVAVGGGAKIRHADGVRMLHAAGRPPFTTESLLRSVVADEPLDRKSTRLNS